MKIGVISDTHDHVETLKKVIDFLNKNCDLVIHCGDLCSPFSAKALLDLKVPLYFTFGNNDAEKCKINEILSKKGKVGDYFELKISEKTFFVCHGHIEALIKNSIGKYDFIIFGHTHEFKVEKIKSSVLINPGELCGCLTGKKTFAVIDLKKEEVKIVDAENFEDVLIYKTY